MGHPGTSLPRLRCRGKPVKTIGAPTKSFHKLERPGPDVTRLTFGFLPSPPPTLRPL